MALSLEKLWKDASDEAVLDTANNWDALNEECQQVLIAEAKRRGLRFEVPRNDAAAEAAAAAAAGTPATTARVWTLVAVLVAGVAALGFFV